MNMWKSKEKNVVTLRNIIEKYISEPKLFYKYINEKIINREGIDKLKVKSTVYKDALQQAEVMNKCFQTVFTREREFRMNNIIAFSGIHKSRRNRSIKANGKSRCQKSVGSRWSVKLDNGRMQ